MAELDVARFFKRLEKLHGHFKKHRETPIWNSAHSLLLHRGPLNDEDPYAKSTVLHQWLFGYELPDTIVLLTQDGHVWILAAKKKCEFIRAAADAIPEGSSIQEIHLLLRSKEDGNAASYETLWKQAGIPENGDAEKAVAIGTIVKERASNKEGGGMLGPWEQKLDEAKEKAQIEWVDAAPGLASVMSVKDDNEQDLMKKSSVLSNKVMKHGYIKKMEEVIDAEESITHEQLAAHVEAILEDPTKINLKVPGDDVVSCYYPIVQSGGKYDLKISAQSTSDSLSHDVITVSLGARYRMYCSNIARTFLVDPPKMVSQTYEVLLEVQEACMAAMRPGKPLKSVYKAAVAYLQQKSGFEHLAEKLPKTLGFAMGLDFRETTLLLSPKNQIAFKPGMVFCLSVGFQDVELSEEDRAATPDNSAVKKRSNYSLLISDMVVVTNSRVPDVLTKMGKALTDVAYNINNEDADDDEDDDDDDDDAPDAPDGDAEMARQMAEETANAAGGRKSARLAKTETAQADVQEGVAEREGRQVKLMQRGNEERLRELARIKSKNKGKGGEQEAEELATYKRPKDYPDSVQPNQVKVDMATQCVILPIAGNPVPFHISTIKNVVLPDPDTTENATLLRLNFYSAGLAVGKDAPANMAKLVAKYAPYASFIREMTFRSLDGHNLTLAYRQISELRKRARTKELKELEEATLVEQEKLVRIKNERVSRLSDLSMRPVFGGRKTHGNLEAHTNGLRFISTRGEVVDIMYNNIKYAIFQPCESEIMVLIHFHLKNPIMVGKKKHLDIQYFTEVIDASQTVDNSKRSMYDPDEMDDEQRERQLRKRLNQAFKEFCKKVDGVAKRYGHEVEFDIPYRDLGFTGNPHREMVPIMPTLNCLVNLTETPFFVVDLEDVDHVHLERVTYMSKAFDIVLVKKDFSQQPWRIDMIPNGDKDSICEWLTDMEITYTEGPMNLNWKQIMNTVKEDDRFYENTEEDEVTEKEAGWEFLRLYGKDDAEDNEDDSEDSEFGDEPGEEEEVESEEDEEAFDSEEDESDFDADEELEEQGMDWEEMETEAAADDKRKRRAGDLEGPGGSNGGGGRRDSSKGRSSGGRSGGGGSRDRRVSGSRGAPPPRKRRR